ncbi:MAG: CarD family transcriptional regulator [Eubacteriales bacterium]|nr:CarD family transcriptional regulator [Eubacteriales bacterium]
MFETGDYVVYGHTGICKVMGVTTMDMTGIPKDRLYYILRPDGQTEGKIFTPVDNGKQVLRRVMSKEEAEHLIDEIPEIEVLGVTDDKQREEKYKECIRSCECREMIRIIKTIYLRKKERVAQGKKATATDERYLKLAEENLYSELSMLLDVPKNKMEKYITARIERR